MALHLCFVIAALRKLDSEFVGLRVLLLNASTCARDLYTTSFELRLQLQPHFSILLKSFTRLVALIALRSLDSIEVLLPAFVKCFL